MNNDLDKKAIRERIEALRKKIQTQGLEPVLEKSSNLKVETTIEHTLGKESFFYLLETKTLIISILICFLIIASAYILSIKTDYLNIVAKFIFGFFS